MLEKVGKNLRDVRRKAGFNQEEVAKKLGISRNKIINIEKGEGLLDVVLLSRLAHLYGCSMDYFICDLPSDQEISFAYRASELGEDEKDIPTWGRRVLGNLRDLQSICREARIIG